VVKVNIRRSRRKTDVACQTCSLPPYTSRNEGQRHTETTGHAVIVTVTDITTYTRKASE
jgi:hypothetical protein